MAVTITRNWGAETQTINPNLSMLSSYSVRRSGQNVIHEILGGGIAVSQRGSASRVGTLALLFVDETDANAALTVLGAPGLFELVDSDRASMNMQFVISGELRLELDSETQSAWVLSLDFREVTP